MLSHTHTHMRKYTHARTRSSLSGASVEANCIPSISWSWGRASGSQRSLGRLSENALQAPARKTNAADFRDERKEKTKMMGEMMEKWSMLGRGVRMIENFTLEVTKILILIYFIVWSLFKYNYLL